MFSDYVPGVEEYSNKLNIFLGILEVILCKILVKYLAFWTYIIIFDRSPLLVMIEFYYFLNHFLP